MRVDIRRFGPGYRRPDGPPGTTGITGQVIWSDERAHVSELAFARRGLIAPHSSPDTSLFIVVSGGGWVQVGEERQPVHHGQAVVWPAGVEVAAWTDGGEMRAILVELAEARAGRRAVVIDAPAASPVAPSSRAARGALAERPAAPNEHDESHGEPW